jgi:uncharacterized membrane protein
MTILKKINQKIRRIFLTGLLVIVPIGVTILILIWMFKTIDNLLAPIVKFVMMKTLGQAITIPGLGLLVGIALVFTAGLIATNIIGRKILKLGDYIVERIPLVRNIYSGSKQIIEAMTLNNQKSFGDPVLIEYPRKGVFTIGFLTSGSKGVNENSPPDRLVNIFIPSAPLPSNGIIVFVPQNRLIHLDMTTEEGVKFIFSMGMFAPDVLKNFSLKQLDNRNQQIDNQVV